MRRNGKGLEDKEASFGCKPCWWVSRDMEVLWRDSYMYTHREMQAWELVRVLGEEPMFGHKISTL